MRTMKNTVRNYENYEKTAQNYENYKKYCTEL